ncbi:transcription antitermination factor NusB [Robbsia andropogonis]|uniref:transcription antitermination factor NusB n=1 Tax=Robbsia andropogonis TaxID=28092 RepID=UPI000466C433|nr:transcription antitermination factor NusB [Robbsia andropogonis]MCP1116647.1 transcription antitermination factor NusB [Robbsia andropogonis]MCP1126674.1 transcription antitermination factor NusB [Robbsia andropogonis]
MRNARRRARELATQALYQWLVAGSAVSDIDAHIRGMQSFDKADREHFDALLYGVAKEQAQLEATITPCLDRPVSELSPVERAVLLVGAYELRHHIDIPYRVVINEGVELAKTFGGTDGYKYVNGVLDKVAAQLRPDETQANRRG